MAESQHAAPLNLSQPCSPHLLSSGQAPHPQGGEVTTRLLLYIPSSSVPEEGWAGPGTQETLVPSLLLYPFLSPLLTTASGYLAPKSATPTTQLESGRRCVGNEVDAVLAWTTGEPPPLRVPVSLLVVLTGGRRACPPLLCSRHLNGFLPCDFTSHLSGQAELRC